MPATKIALVVLCLASFGCATLDGQGRPIDRYDVVKSRMNSLKGHSLDEVVEALCNSCDVSHDSKRLKCRAYIDGCGGRFDHVRATFNDVGNMVSWFDEDR